MLSQPGEGIGDIAPYCLCEPSEHAESSEVLSLLMKVEEWRVRIDWTRDAIGVELFRVGMSMMLIAFSMYVSIERYMYSPSSILLKMGLTTVWVVLMRADGTSPS